MSSGYASRLSPYPDKGICGLPEVYDSDRALKNKIQTLKELIREAMKTPAVGHRKKKQRTAVLQSGIVFLTGAGISTSAGIRDFRGPRGVWTLEQRQERDKVKKKKTSSTPDDEALLKKMAGEVNSIEDAKPTLCHRALTYLASHPLPPDKNAFNEHEQSSHRNEKNDKISFPCPPVLRFCVTQNIDGLHRRSNFPRDKLSILHGCSFTEICEKCHHEHFRDYDVGTVGMRLTGRSCEKCDGALRDSVLDWDDELPELDYGLAVSHCQCANLVISLGTSLRITPAGGLPLLAKKFVIVNLQATPYDDQAALVIRAKVDDVISSLMISLGFCEWLNETTVT